MRRSVRTLAAGVCCVCVFVGVTDAASARTVGRDIEPTDSGSCGLGGSFFQAGDNANYGIPESGVLTSWRLRGVQSVDSFKFKVGRGASDILTVGETSGTLANGRIEAAARIPVQAGDRIGLWAGTTIVSFRCGDSPGVNMQSRTEDVPPGQTATYTNSPPFPAIPLSAVVEPDADGDGYGDDSQDLCRTDATTQGPCPVAAPVARTTPRDTIAPAISNARFSASVFAVRSGAAASAVAKGTKVSITLSEASTVIFVTEQRVKGKWRKVRIFGKRFPAGRSTLNYSGKIKPRGKQRALKPGRYRLRMRPSDRAGNKGKVTTIGFRIAK